MTGWKKRHTPFEDTTHIIRGNIEEAKSDSNGSPTSASLGPNSIEKNPTEKPTENPTEKPTEIPYTKKKSKNG